MSLTNEERKLIEKAIWFYANEGQICDTEADELCERLERQSVQSPVLKVYRVRFMSGADHIALAESAEEAEQVFTDHYINPFMMKEVCEVKKDTYIS